MIYFETCLITDVAGAINDACFVPRAGEFGILTGGDLKYLAAASTVIQLVYLLSLLGTINSSIELIHNDSLWDSGNANMMAGAISVVLTYLIIGASIGSVGVFLAWLVLRDGKSRPSWFLTVSIFFAWTWMVFIPIGTLIGVFMLRWRRPIQIEDSAMHT